MDIITLEAIFTTDGKEGWTHTFPYLGQLAFLGILDEYTSVARVPSIRSYTPACTSVELRQQFDEGINNGIMKETLENATWPDRWFRPEDAWKTIESIRNVMLSEDKEALLEPIESIRQEVADECEKLRQLLEGAAARNLRFKVEIGIMDHPPLRLREWTDRHEAALYGDILDMLEDAGIDIKKEDDE